MSFSFDIFEGRSSEFLSWGILTCSLKFQYQYFISIISFADTFAETVFDTNDIILTSLEGTHFIFSYKN